VEEEESDDDEDGDSGGGDGDGESGDVSEEEESDDEDGYSGGGEAGGEGGGVGLQGEPGDMFAPGQPHRFSGWQPSMSMHESSCGHSPGFLQLQASHDGGGGLHCGQVCAMH